MQIDKKDFMEAKDLAEEILRPLAKYKKDDNAFLSTLALAMAVESILDNIYDPAEQKDNWKEKLDNFYNMTDLLHSLTHLIKKKLIKKKIN